MTLVFLGGEPTVLYLTFLFLLVYGMVSSWGSVKAVVANVVSLLFSLLVAAGLSAIQLIPFLEVVGLSYRTVHPDFGFISAGSFPPRELLNFVFPFFFGNPILGTYEKGLLGDQFQTWLLSPYLGIFPIIFSLLSLLKTNRKIMFFWLMAVFSFLLAFGRFTPVYGWFFNLLPGIAMIRYPVKFIFLAVFSLSVLGGLGFEVIQGILIKQKKQLERLIFVLGILLILLGGFYLWGKGATDQIFLYLRGFYPAYLHPYLVDLLWKLIYSNLWSLSNLVLTLGLGLAAFYLAYKEVFSKGTVLFVIFGIVLVDLVLVNMGVNPPGDSRVFSELTPNLQIIKADRGQYRYYVTPRSGQENVLVQLTFSQSLYNQKDNLQLNWAVVHQVPSILGRESIEPRPVKVLANADEKLLDLANVKYIISDKPIRGLKLLR
ncbi:MAG: hypothetical protein ACPL4K_04170, partial [Candidatus Margulisiibacteriota bacterium]